MGRTRLAAVLLAIISPPATFADIVLENARLRAVLSADASWRSLIDKSTGDDLCAADQPVPLATISAGQRTYPATAAQLAGDQLVLRFADCDTQLTYAVSRHDDWLALFDEMTSRLAHVFNDCDFDMVYFDGSEDVDTRRFDYFATNAHVATLRKFRKRPLIHMGGGFTHGLWHSFTRSGTVDQYPGTYLAYLHAGGTLDRWPTCKDHIDGSVRGVLACEADMTPGELGWFGIGPKSGNYDGLQYDEIEYLMCKSLAYNAPISLQTSFARMESHPLTPDSRAGIPLDGRRRLLHFRGATVAGVRQWLADVTLELEKTVVLWLPTTSERFVPQEFEQLDANADQDRRAEPHAHVQPHRPVDLKG